MIPELEDCAVFNNPSPDDPAPRSASLAEVFVSHGLFVEGVDAVTGLPPGPVGTLVSLPELAPGGRYFRFHPEYLELGTAHPSIGARDRGAIVGNAPPNLTDFPDSLTHGWATSLPRRSFVAFSPW